MADPELKIFFDGYELVMSRTINLSDGKLTVCFENLAFNFEFLCKKRHNASAECTKKENGETTIFNIKVYDSDTEVHGLLNPMEIGRDDGHNYYISLVGMHGLGNYRQVVFNLLRCPFDKSSKIKNRQVERPAQRKSVRERAIYNVKFALVMSGILTAAALAIAAILAAALDISFVSMGPILAIVGLMAVYAAALGFVALKHI